MERSKLLAQALAVTFIVSGCSLVSDDKQASLSSPSLETTIISDLDGMDGDTQYVEAQGTTDVERETVYGQEDINGNYNVWSRSSAEKTPDPISIEKVRGQELSSTIVQNSVQVFSLSNNKSSMRTDSMLVKPVAARGEYVPTRFLSRDGALHVSPSVSVFPLDEAMARTFDAQEKSRQTAPVAAPLEARAALNPVTLRVPDGRVVEPEKNVGGESKMMFTNVAPIKNNNEVNAEPASIGNVEVIYFAHNTSKIEGAELRKIDHVVDVYNANTAATVNVLGHANLVSTIHDPIERQIANLKISMNRAFSVARVLMKKGIPTENIRTSGYGEGHLAGSQNGMDAQAASRRVEVSIGK